MAGTCKSMRTMSRMARSVRGNMCKLLKMGKTKGAALVQVLYATVGPADKRVL